MIPKKLHRLMADLKKLTKRVEQYDSLSGAEQAATHDEEQKLDAEWQSFKEEERNEAITFYGVDKKKEVAPRMKTNLEKKFEQMEVGF